MWYVQRFRSGCGSVAAVWRSCPAAEWVTSSGRNTRTSSLRVTPTHTSSKSLNEFWLINVRISILGGLFFYVQGLHLVSVWDSRGLLDVWQFKAHRKGQKGKASSRSRWSLVACVISVAGVLISSHNSLFFMHLGTKWSCARNLFSLDQFVLAFGKYIFTVGGFCSFAFWSSCI